MVCQFYIQVLFFFQIKYLLCRYMFTDSKKKRSLIDLFFMFMNKKAFITF